VHEKLRIAGALSIITSCAGGGHNMLPPPASPSPKWPILCRVGR